jgi:hypothetical protein
MVDPATYAISVTSAEWRSLLGYGELRISKRRVQQVSQPITPKECRRLFSWMPTTAMGDENDTIVLELASDWLESSQKVSSHPAELVLLSRGAVNAHHCVGPSSFAYLSSDAQREGVELTMGRYEPAWIEWVAELTASQEMAAAKLLLAGFDLALDVRKKRPDGYRWLDIISLSKHSKTVIRPRPKHVESLLRSVREIGNAVSGVHSTEAFNIAVNVEWIAAKLGKDPLKNRELREQIDSAIAAAKEFPWSAAHRGSSATPEAIHSLETAFSKAYSEDITPDSVAQIVRHVMAAKEQTLAPKDFVMSMHLLRQSSPEAAILLGVAVAGALGPVMTRRLARSLTMNDPMDLDWTDS